MKAIDEGARCVLSAIKEEFSVCAIELGQRCV
jgi:hypothetical protein